MSLLLEHTVVKEPDYVSAWLANLLGASWRLDLWWEEYGITASLTDPRLVALDEDCS